MSTCNPFEVDKSYVSPYDKFLYELSKKELSDSQRKEYEKHKKIARLRDNAQGEDATGEVWREF